jgi:hypothetical protein
LSPAQLIEARRICALSWWTLTGDHTHQALALLRAALPLLEAAAAEGARIHTPQDPNNLTELDEECLRLVGRSNEP